MAAPAVPGIVIEYSERLGHIAQKYRGQNGDKFNSSATSKPPNFVPLPELESLWSDTAINSVLKAYNPPLTHTADVIRRRFIRVFSVLVYLSDVQYLNLFTKYSLTDDKFPLLAFPPPWSNSPPCNVLFERVQEFQWMFFPFIFGPLTLHGPILNPHYVIPIIDETILQDGDIATVYKITVHSSCSNLDNNTLVRKCYTGEKGTTRFKREQKAFNSLETYSTRNIISYYGTFRQVQADGTEVYNLILEFANRGSLKNFFCTAEPPTTPADVQLFWESITRVLWGLHRLHQDDKNPNNKDGDYRIVHQDLKPENLLLADGQSTSIYDFDLKIADFGYSSTGLVDTAKEDFVVVDSHGGPSYGAPECSHHHPSNISGKNRITADADIFSMGCILSDTATWVISGEQGRNEYHNRRKAEHSKIKTFQGSGNDGCFHNGISRLDAVVAMHTELRHRAALNDTITPQIIDIIEGHMLIRQSEGRWCSNELANAFSDIVQKPPDSDKEEPAVPPPFEKSSNGIAGNLDPDFNHTLGRKSTDMQNDPQYKLTYDDALAYYKAKKARSSVDKSVQDLVNGLRSNLGQRDHIFFMDTSPSMGRHKSEAFEAFQLFAYLAKLIDTNGIELCFAARPSKVFKESNVTPLLAKLKEQTWDNPAFEDKFSQFIHEVVISRLPSKLTKWLTSKKRLSIFVFTDGRWGHDFKGACGVENPINALMDKIGDRGLDRTQVMIQFIRFGDDPEGKNHLRYLDFLGRDRNCDVVDTKPVRSNVDAMFYGSIDLNSDQVDEEALSPSSPRMIRFHSESIQSTQRSRYSRASSSFR